MNPRFLCAGLVSFAVATTFSADILDDTLRLRYSFDAAPSANVIVDSSLNASHPGTNRNAVWIGSELGRNGVMDFSALIPDRITVPAIPAYNSSQGTISFWIKTPGSSGPGDYAAMLIDRRESSGDVITLTDSGTLFVQAREGFQNKNAFAGVALLNDNQWHHVAYVYDQSAEGSVSLYVDGVLDATNPNSAPWTWEPTRALEFGSSHDPFWRVFDGLMDDVNVYNRKLTDTEIANTAAGTPVTDNSLVLRINFASAPVNNVIVDTSASNNPGTNAGAIFVAADGTHNGVMKFEIPVMTQIATAGAEDIDSTVGTIAFWMKSTGNAGLGDYASILFDRRLSNVGDQLTMVDDGTLFVQARAGGGNVNTFATQGRVNDGLWHHIAYVYDQSDVGYIKIFIDGALSGSNSNTGAWSWPIDQPFEFGLSHDTYWHAFDGQLDEIRFYNQALTAAQIADIGVPPTLKFDAQPQSDTVFVGDDVTLRGLANIEATYQWKLNGQDVPGATSNVLYIASATAANTGTYTLTANSIIGPGTSDPAVLTVNPRPSVDASLVARYPFDAAPVNNVIIDAAPGNDHPGTNILATWTDAVDGHNGVMFFESAQPSQIVIAPHSEFDSSRGTIALWIKSPGAFAPGDYGSIIFDRRSNRGDVIVMQDNGAIFTQTHSTSARVSTFSTPDVVNDDLWHHIAYVYDQVAGGSIAVYIDGQLSMSNEISGPWSWDPARPLEIGKSGDSYWKRFDGYMDDIRFYNRRMNAAEIAQIVGLGDPLPSLSISKSGNQITLTWVNGGSLQETSDIGNANGWANVAGNPQSPVTITIPATGNKFYRLLK